MAEPSLRFFFDGRRKRREPDEQPRENASLTARKGTRTGRGGFHGCIFSAQLKPGGWTSELSRRLYGFVSPDRLRAPRPQAAAPGKACETTGRWLDIPTAIGSCNNCPRIMNCSPSPGGPGMRWPVRLHRRPSPARGLTFREASAGGERSGVGRCWVDSFRVVHHSSGQAIDDNSIIRQSRETHRARSGSETAGQRVRCGLFVGPEVRSPTDVGRHGRFEAGKADHTAVQNDAALTGPTEGRVLHVDSPTRHTL